MKFEPIQTKEDFDARVQELYGDVKDLQGQITTLTGERDAHAKTIADLQSQIKGYQSKELRQKIAASKGIPADMADRLTGENEKELSADADRLAKSLKAIKGPPPIADPNRVDPDNKNAALINMLQELRGE